MMGNYHVRFLRGDGVAIRRSYLTMSISKGYACLLKIWILLNDLLCT